MSNRKKSKVAALFLRRSETAPRPRPVVKRQRRARIGGGRWTSAEDAIVRTLAATTLPGRRARRPIDWPRVLAALPGRTVDAIIKRRLVLKLPTAGRRWTPAEDKIIKDHWQECARRTISDKLPGRSWPSVCSRAFKLGLATVPQGWQFFEVACRQANVCPPTGHRILAWANRWAPLVEALCAWGYECSRLSTPAPWEPGGYDGGAVVERRHSTVWVRKGATREGGRCTLLEEGSLTAAAHRWATWEEAPDAAARLGVSRDVAVRAVVTEGYAQRGPIRGPRYVLPPAWWDDAVARRRPRGRTRAADARAAGRTGL